MRALSFIIGSVFNSVPFLFVEKVIQYPSFIYSNELWTGTKRSQYCFYFIIHQTFFSLSCVSVWVLVENKIVNILYLHKIRNWNPIVFHDSPKMPLNILIYVGTVVPMLFWKITSASEDNLICCLLQKYLCNPGLMLHVIFCDCSVIFCDCSVCKVYKKQSDGNISLKIEPIILNAFWKIIT